MKSEKLDLPKSGTATHGSGENVKFRLVKDFLGQTQVKFTFDNGESSITTIPHFKREFSNIKN